MRLAHHRASSMRAWVAASIPLLSDAVCGVAEEASTIWRPIAIRRHSLMRRSRHILSNSERLEAVSLAFSSSVDTAIESPICVASSPMQAAMHTGLATGLVLRDSWWDE